MSDWLSRKKEVFEGPALQPFLPLSHYVKTFGLSRVADDVWPLLEVQDRHHFLRDRYTHEYGFCLPTTEVMSTLCSILGAIGPSCKVLDAGSGSGFLAQELSGRGIDVTAVDRCDYEDHSKKFGYAIKTLFKRDILGDAVKVAGEFDVILLAWPPHNQPFAQRIAAATSPGSWLIYEGEGQGGCTADDAFFDTVLNPLAWDRKTELEARLNECHITFFGLHDSWMVFRRR